MICTVRAGNTRVIAKWTKDGRSWQKMDFVLLEKCKVDKSVWKQYTARGGVLEGSAGTYSGTDQPQ